MDQRCGSRRAYLAGLAAAGAPLLAGCPSGSGTDGENPETSDGSPVETTSRTTERSSTSSPDTTTETTAEPTETTPTPGGPVKVDGRLVDLEREPITSGIIYAIGGTNAGILERGPTDGGRYGFELTANVTYAIQYGDSPEGLPDLFTIAVLRPTADRSLGLTALPEAFPVEVTVETGDGTDVTDDAGLRAWHYNDDGDSSWVDIVDQPIELAGEVEVGASYQGTVVERSLTVTSPTSVTLTVEE